VEGDYRHWSSFVLALIAGVWIAVSAPVVAVYALAYSALGLARRRSR
jgi:hypothetical protein